MEVESRAISEYSADEKRALLTRLLEKKARAPKIAPLSLGQERLWFLDQLTPGNPAYNMFTGVRLKGELNVTALEKSFNEIIRRHEILRTSFPSIDGAPAQVIAPAVTLTLPLVDLSSLPEPERDAEVRRFAEEEDHRPFVLADGPLLRAKVLRLGEQEHAVLVNMHHIISDGWSLDIFTREMGILYEAFSTGQASPLGELPIQYSDFAHWQRQWLRGEVLESRLSYWKDKLEGIPLLLDLPIDHPRPLMQRFRGAARGFRISTDLWAGLKELNRQEGVTIFMTLLSAFQTLLYRYTAQDDINIGIPTAGRDRLETESLIGFFLNTLVIRARFTDDLTFREVLSQTRQSILEAHENQDLPFEKLVEALGPKRSLSYEPIVQVAFVFVVTPSNDGKVPELKAEGLSTRNYTSKYDLSLYVQEMVNGLVLAIQYNSDLFEDATIARMLRHYEVILREIVINSGQQVSNMRLLLDSERQQLLTEWNNTRKAYPSNQCIHELFEQQAAGTPKAEALVCGGDRLTYEELNRRANQLAHHLRSLGVGPETLVGVMMERGVELVIALLGILKAGGAYVPLDPAYPAQRLRFMLDDLRAPLLLTQRPLLERVSAEFAPRAICLDTDWSRVTAGLPDTNPEVFARPECLAYLIYTSGSSGKPKGVMIQHRGLCNMVKAQIEAFGVRSDSRVLQFASLSFDASVSEIFMALLAGASLYMESRDSLMAGPGLIQTLRKNQITTVTLPPSVLAVLEREQLPALEAIIAAGESCALETARRWIEGNERRRFFDAYGPTEFTVCATIAELDGSRITIGRPIANAQAYILDGNLQPVPIGVCGELHLGGVGLARGYLNGPELTAEKFIPNPFSLNTHDTGQRLYKTGDLARRLPDGSIEFLGRIDNQLKVRGYRIEAGEIETLLNNHPEVRASLVIAREDGAGEKQLAAYCVPQRTGGSGGIEIWPSVAEYYIYDDFLYYAMTADERRNHSYKVAINRHVPGKVVLDIGTGKDAILARFCVAAGAAKVYAIELLEEAYEKAKATIEGLGLADKIILIHGNSMEVELPEKIDVCVSEIVGPIGGCEGASTIINNAWRFMKPDGVMIPARSVTKIAAITLPEEFLANPSFTKVSAHYVERVFEEIGHRFDLRLCMRNFSKTNVISNYQPFEVLNFTRSIEPEFEQEIELSINRDANLAGFVVWLNLHTVEDEVVDILEQEYCWLPVYLPVFYPGVEARQGDRIEGTVCGRMSDNNLNLDYTVTGKFVRQSGESIDFEYTTYHHKEIFQATEFHKKVFPDGRINTLEGFQPEAWEKNLKTYLKDTLPDYMIPSFITTIDVLPLTPNGKIDHNALPGPEQTGKERLYVAPNNSLESQLALMWEELLGRNPVGIRESFFELGGHSLLAVRLMAKIRKCFGIDLPISTLFRSETIEELAKTLNEQSSAQRWSPLVPIQPQGTKPRFFCVHALGGNVNHYYLLARYLGSDQPFYGLQAPPLQEAAEEDAQIERMAARYVEAVQEVQSVGPYLIGGYSFGSFIAYEMAQQFRARGEAVSLLALFDTYSPLYANRVRENRDVAQMLVTLAWTLSREKGKRLLLPVEELRRLTFDEQLDFFLEKMREEDLVPAEVDHQLLSRFLKGSAARQRAAHKYIPRAYPGRVTIFKCEERDQLWNQRLLDAGLDPHDETLGWQELSAEPVVVIEIPGHHNVICQEPFVQSLADSLHTCLEAAAAPPTCTCDRASVVGC